MTTPTHLSHKPIVAVDDYKLHDGFNGTDTDVESLSIGEAQYNSGEISAKVFRNTGTQWSRQSEELPLHRVIDLSTTILESILLSAGMPSYPQTSLKLTTFSKNNLGNIANFYIQNRSYILPKLQELQTMLDYFMKNESKI
jgi:hypothetical protein